MEQQGEGYLTGCCCLCQSVREGEGVRLDWLVLVQGDGVVLTVRCTTITDSMETHTSFSDGVA